MTGFAAALVSASGRVCSGESLTDLAYQAALQALEDSHCQASALDLMICATISADYATHLFGFACCGCAYGAHCPAFDVNARPVLAFSMSLDIAAGYFARNRQRKLLLVGAEAMSRIWWISATAPDAAC